MTASRRRAHLPGAARAILSCMLRARCEDPYHNGGPAQEPEPLHRLHVIDPESEKPSTRLCSRGVLPAGRVRSAGLLFAAPVGSDASAVRQVTVGRQRRYNESAALGRCAATPEIQPTRTVGVRAHPRAGRDEPGYSLGGPTGNTSRRPPRRLGDKANPCPGRSAIRRAGPNRIGGRHRAGAHDASVPGRPPAAVPSACGRDPQTSSGGMASARRRVSSPCYWH